MVLFTEKGTELGYYTRWVLTDSSQRDGRPKKGSLIMSIKQAKTRSAKLDQRPAYRS